MTDWSQVVQQHGPIVWRTARRLLNNEADACDCFQRTFISAMELERGEIIRNWPALLRRLATARALEFIRRQRRESNRVTALMEDAVADPKGCEPDTSAQSNELAEHLRHALAEIDARQAQVFCLACLDDLSYQEIAEQLGITVSHVGVLLSRARAALRDRLGAHAPAPRGLQAEGEMKS